jgi:tRNA U34 5-carboxymethylaminomethyl modifying enzyme MnmG/GidA
MVIADSDSNKAGVILFTAHDVNGISLWEKANHQGLMVNQCKFQV